MDTMLCWMTMAIAEWLERLTPFWNSFSIFQVMMLVLSIWGVFFRHATQILFRFGDPNSDFTPDTAIRRIPLSVRLKWKRRLRARAFQICRSRLFIRTRRRDMAILLQQRGQRRWRLAIVPELRRIGPSSRHHWNQRGRFGLPATFQRDQFWSASSSAAAGDAEKDGVVIIIIVRPWYDTIFKFFRCMTSSLP